MPSGGLCATYHLLWQPETTIEQIQHGDSCGFHVSQGRSIPYIGDKFIPHLLGNPSNGFFEPLIWGWWVYPLLQGNFMGSLDLIAHVCLVDLCGRKKGETFVKVMSRYLLGCFGETNGLKFQKSFLSRFTIVIYEWTNCNELLVLNSWDLKEMNVLHDYI